MRTTLESTRLHVHPGQPALFDIDVTNTSSVIDGVSALVVGIDPAWVQLVLPMVSLFPESSGRLSFRFDVPTSCPAGEVPLVIRVFSTIDAAEAMEHEVILVVEPVEAATLRLKPSVVTGGASAELHAIIANTGNVPTEFRVAATEPNRVLECHAEPGTLLVPPGEERAVAITARGRRPWFGNPLPRTVVVEAASPSIELTQSARFDQRPRVARGVVTALILAGIILLWAFIFLWVIDVLGQRDTAKKAVGKGFLDGSSELSITNIGGRVTGRVTAASTGDGLERITVEAYRVDRKGTIGDPSTSTATAEDGTYILDALLPGTYRLRFSADGFTPQWCGTTTKATDLMVMPVDPDLPATTCNVVLVGGTGSLTVAVEVPEGTTGDAVVTVQQVTPAGVTAPPATTATKQLDGTYAATGLATPAPYKVTIAFPGFEPTTTVVQVGGGQQAVLDPSALVASSGVISGTVQDAKGAPLGNVTVTLRNGSLERTVITPTVAGSIGQYRFEGLPTPGSYVITFTLPGYSSTTRSLELGPGESSAGTVATLVGGQGSIRGTVTATNAAGAKITLGGVIVTVTSGSYTASTATLTGSVGNGTYSLAGLPAPGYFTVKFSAPGYRSEFVTLRYTAPGEQVLNVSMTSSVAQLRGTVLVDGTAKGGVRVELSDGTTPKVATTSASPAGAFSFLDVPPGSYTLTFWPTYQIDGVVQPPVAVVQVRVTAGQVWTQTISIPSHGP